MKVKFQRICVKLFNGRDKNIQDYPQTEKLLVNLHKTPLTNIKLSRSPCAMSRYTLRGSGRMKLK